MGPETSALIERYLSPAERARLETLTTALNAEQHTPAERLANGAELSFALTTLLAERGYGRTVGSSLETDIGRSKP